MTQAEAMDRLIMLTDANSEPVLSPADLEVLLSQCKRLDRFGVLPEDTAWEETYDVNFGAAQGWLIKAGRLASRYNFMSGGKMLSRQQYYDHCMKMYYRYAMKSPLKSTRLETNTWSQGMVPNNAESW